MAGDYVNLYFSNEQELAELKTIAEEIGTSLSALVSEIAVATIPELRRAVKQNKRSITATITIPLFGQDAPAKTS